MQKRKNRWYIAVAAVVILAVVLVLAVVPGKKGKNKKDPKMIEPTQQEQASEIPTETEEVFDYSATETAETKSLPKSVVSKQGILIDVDAGTILAGKDALKRMVPASMTKIFTVLVAAENIKPEQLDELVTISIDAAISVSSRLLWLNIFRCYQHGKDFGHRCRNHTFQCIFSGQNRSGIHINENSLLADNGLRKRFCLCGLRSGIIKYFLCFRRYFRCLLLLRRLNHLWIFFVLSLFPRHNCQYQNNC